LPQIYKRKSKNKQLTPLQKIKQTKTTKQITIKESKLIYQNEPKVYILGIGTTTLILAPLSPGDSGTLGSLLFA